MIIKLLFNIQSHIQAAYVQFCLDFCIQSGSAFVNINNWKHQSLMWTTTCTFCHAYTYTYICIYIYICTPTDIPIVYHICDICILRAIVNWRRAEFGQTYLEGGRVARGGTKSRTAINESLKSRTPCVFFRKDLSCNPVSRLPRVCPNALHLLEGS